MQGYIKRLTQDIERTELKRDCIADFLTYCYQEVDEKQAEMMNKQFAIMNQLIEIMKQRLEYEQQIHPERFEDLPEEDCEDDSEE